MSWGSRRIAMTRMIAALISLAFVLTSANVFADAAGQLGVTLKTVVSGKASPAIVIQPKQDVKSVTARR